MSYKPGYLLNLIMRYAKLISLCGYLWHSWIIISSIILTKMLYELCYFLIFIILLTGSIISMYFKCILYLVIL